MSRAQADVIRAGAPRRNSVGYGDAQVCIELDEEHVAEERVAEDSTSTPVYTPGSTITGLMTIRPAYCLPFDYFSIAFVGEADTQLNDSSRAPEDSQRVFLRMQMPIDPEGLPRSMKFKVGETYHHPVFFKIPSYLPMGACEHDCQSDQVRENHLRLPPSVGSWRHRTDQSPKAVAIHYTIRVQAYQLRRGAFRLMMQYRKLVRVLPLFSPDAMPPSLDPAPGLDELHTHQLGWRASLSRIAVLRKSWGLAANAGKLETTVLRPCPLLFSAATGKQITKPTPCISMVFTPGTAHTSPPRLRAITVKVVATTFYASAPMSYIPIPSTRQPCEAGAAPANHAVSVSSCAKSSQVESFMDQTLDWKAETESDSCALTRDPSDKASRSCSDSLVAPATRYTAFLRLPITNVNTDKLRYLPTFHSCMVSRSYTLQVQLSIGAIGSSVKLDVPLVVGIHPATLPTYNEEASVSMPSGAIAVQDAAAAGDEVGHLPEYFEFPAVSPPAALLATVHGQ